MSNREKKIYFTVTPLYLQAYQRLAAQIAAGVWPVGKPLPNENDLARELGISSGTVRKALDQLEMDQLVSRQAGRGTFVTSTEPARPCPACCGTGRIAPEKAA